MKFENILLDVKKKKAKVKRKLIYREIVGKLFVLVFVLYYCIIF